MLKYMNLKKNENLTCVFKNKINRQIKINFISSLKLPEIFFLFICINIIPKIKLDEHIKNNCGFIDDAKNKITGEDKINITNNLLYFCFYRNLK